MNRKIPVVVGIVLAVLAGVYAFDIGRPDAASSSDDAGDSAQRSAPGDLDFQSASEATDAAVVATSRDTKDGGQAVEVPPTQLPSSPPTNGERPGVFESRLFVGTSVSGDVLDEVLKDKQDFDKVLSELGKSSTAETLARSRDYEAMLNATLGEVASGTSVDRLTCGVNMCFASVNTRDRKALREWQSLIQSVATLPMPTFTARAVQLPNGGFQNRIFFTTNSAYNSFRSAFRPPPRP